MQTEPMLSSSSSSQVHIDTWLPRFSIKVCVSLRPVMALSIAAASEPNRLVADDHVLWCSTMSHPSDPYTTSTAHVCRYAWLRLSGGPGLLGGRRISYE